MEEICNLDFTGHDDSEVGWLSKIMKKTIDKQWLIEKEIFLNTPVVRVGNLNQLERREKV